MARYRFSLKVKDLACIFDSNVEDSFKAFAQSILTLKTLYDWFDWSCIDDVILMPGDPDNPEGFAISSIKFQEDNVV